MTPSEFKEKIFKLLNRLKFEHDMPISERYTVISEIEEMLDVLLP